LDIRIRYISDTTMVQTGIVKAWFEEKEVQEKVRRFKQTSLPVQSVI
jgi:hypothetical protein